MTIYEWLGIAIAAITGALTAFMKQYKIGPFMPSFDRIGPPEGPYVPSSVPVPGKDHVTYSEPVVTNMPITNSTESTPVEPPTLLWDTPQHAFHSVRVICDEMRLSYDEKNLICACIYQESEFKNWAIGRNGTSTDWGLTQINDYWHIGKNKTFPSIEYVVNNPEACVCWMIKMYKAGQLKLWVSYSSGAYKKWLSTDSKMWKLKKV